MFLIEPAPKPIRISSAFTKDGFVQCVYWLAEQFNCKAALLSI